jgi:hypothetical protein
MVEQGKAVSTVRCAQTEQQVRAGLSRLLSRKQPWCRGHVQADIAALLTRVFISLISWP